MSNRTEFTADETSAIEAWARRRGWGVFSWQTDAGRRIVDLSPPGMPPAFILEPEATGVTLWSWEVEAAFKFQSVAAALSALKPVRRSQRWRVAA